MDLSPIEDALGSKSYATIADTCDELMLQVASRGIAYQEEWPYVVHLLGHLFVNDLNSARYLWKSTPQGIKESRPELVAAWKIGQCLWTRDYAGVYEAIRGFEWSPGVADLVTALSENYTKKMFQLLNSAYSTISVADVAYFLGMTEDNATNYELWNNGGTKPLINEAFSQRCRKPIGPWFLYLYKPPKNALQHGWTLDSSSKMMTVKSPKIVTKQKRDAGKLQRLTEYVYHLEH